MKYNLTEEKNWRRKMEITIPEEDVKQKFGEVYEALKKEAHIPGFRPGKAPMEIIKSRYGKLAEKEVLETMIPDAYTAAVKESGVFPISEPEFVMPTVEDGKPIVFTASFDIKPEFTLQKYTSFTLKRGSELINETEVEKTFNHIIDQHSTLKNKENQVSVEGDVVIVDMDKLSDPDNVIKDNKLIDFTFELNRKVTLPEFTDNLIGTCPGDVREIKVNYPPDYYDKNMAGRKFEFRVTVKEVKQIVRPELNLDFFSQFDGAQSADDLKEKIRVDLKAQRKQEIESDIKDQVVKSVIAANEFDLPQSLLDNYLDTVVEDIKEQYKNKKIDEFRIREQYKTTGIRFIRWNLLLHRIADQEKITVTKEDTDKWLQNFADRSKVSLEQAKEYLAAQKRIQDIKETILEEKVMDFIIKSSVIEDME